ncbi:hypothetical protein BS78_03G378500 [Paspalum vaginatum]|nr:hypothetical protein BS78_03G378500 [Paspalum vaginatum]
MAGRKASNAAALVALLIVAVAAAAGAIKLCGVDSSAVDACKPYCKVGSNLDNPGALCCGKVKNAQWDCLCQFKDNLPEYVDPVRVMALASKCPCDYPPASCGVY